MPGPGKSETFAEQLMDHADESVAALTEPLGDKRPAGWTEALALEFIATQMSVECETIAALFNEGAWPEIQKEFPEFQTWLNSHMEGHRG